MPANDRHARLDPVSICSLFTGIKWIPDICFANSGMTVPLLAKGADFPVVCP